MAETVKIPIELQLEKINQNQTELNKFVSNIQGQLSKIQKEAKNTGNFFSGLGGNLIKAFTGLGVLDSASRAIRGIGSALAAPIESAIEAEDALKRFNVSLALTGKFTEETSKAFDEYADSIEKSTKFTAEAVLESASLIQTIGRLEKDTLKRATQASIDLASSLGIDLATASQLVGKAAEGNVSAFNRYGIAIKKGKTDTETFANTLSTLEERFKDAALISSQSFSGALFQVKTAFDDLTEEFGKAIVSSGGFITVIKTITNVFKELTPFAEKLAKTLASLFVNFIQLSLKAAAGFIEFSRIVSESIQSVIIALNKVFTLFGALGDGLSDVFNTESINKTNKAFEKTSFALLEINQNIENAKKTDINKALNDKFKQISDGAKKTGKTIEDNLVKEVEKLEESLKKVGLSSLQVIEQEANEKKKILNELYKNRAISSEKFIELESKIEIEAAKKTADEIEKISKESFDKQQKRANAFLNLNIDEIIQEIKIRASLDTVDILNLTAGFTNILKKGAEGAGEILAKGVGFVADSLIPGIGKAVEGIFNFLAQGSKKIREQINAFLTAIPDILIAVGDSLQRLPTILTEAALNFVLTLVNKIPEFVGTFFDGILNTLEVLLVRVPEIITAIVQRIPEVIIQLVNGAREFTYTLVDSLPIFIDALIQSIPLIIEAFITSIPLITEAVIADVPKIIAALSKAILIELPPAIYKGLLKALDSAFISFRDSLADSVRRAFAPIIKIFEAIPGVGGQGLVPNKVPILGRLATGGTVPSGFPNDSFTAGLTSGEMVVPKSDVEQLRSFLRKEQTDDNTNLLKEVLSVLRSQKNQNNDTPIVINIGGKTIVDTLKSELKSGRVIFS